MIRIWPVVAVRKEVGRGTMRRCCCCCWGRRGSLVEVWYRVRAAWDCTLYYLNRDEIDMAVVDVDRRRRASRACLGDKARTRCTRRWTPYDRCRSRLHAAEASSGDDGDDVVVRRLETRPYPPVPTRWSRGVAYPDRRAWETTRSMMPTSNARQTPVHRPSSRSTRRGCRWVDACPT